MTKKDRLEALIGHYSDGKPSIFAKYIGVAPSTISSWLSRDTLDYDLLFAKCENLSPEWLLTGKGDMLKKKINTYADKEDSGMVAEPIPLYRQRKANDAVSIPIVEIYAAAGQGYMNTENLLPTGEINLPKTMFRSNGLRYCVRIKGFSMAPTLQDSDYLIIRHLNTGEWQAMPDGHVYLVVDKDGMAYVKRVKNRFNRGFIVLTSDSIEKSSYPNFNLQADEVANIFYAEWHFSAKMQNINETYYDRLKLLEDRFDNIENVLKINKIDPGYPTL